MLSLRTLLQEHSSPHLPLPLKFLACFFVVLQEMLDQPSIAVIRLFPKDNAFSKKIRLFLLAHLLVGFDFAVLFICFLWRCFTVQQL